MKLTIIGCDDFDYYDFVEEKINKIQKYENKQISQIISNGLMGIGTLAQQYAKQHNIKLTTYFPNWERHGKRAEYIRNLSITNDCDLCVVFWDYKSLGVKTIIDFAKQSGKNTMIFNVKSFITRNELNDITKEIDEINSKYKKHMKKLKKYMNFI